LREWAPGIVLGVVTAQLAAPHLRGSALTAVFGLFTLMAAVRFAAPTRFRPLFDQPPNGNLRHLAGLGIGLVSGFAGVGGGIMTNVVMVLSGVPMHKSIGRAAAVGVVVSLPATIVAAFGSAPAEAGNLGSINLSMWACIAPAQAVAAWFGARMAQHVAAENLSRLFAGALAATGIVMLRSSLG
jgi:uncharacterized membrane protein YfcA